MQRVVSRAEHPDGAAAVKEGVADRAVADTMPLERGKPRDRKRPPGGAGCKNDAGGRSLPLSGQQAEALRLPGEVERLREKNLRAERPGLLEAAVGQRLAADRLFKAKVIFNLFGLLQRTEVLAHQQGAAVGTAEIDGRALAPAGPSPMMMTSGI